MLAKLFSAACIFLICTITFAEVNTETTCYVNVPPDLSSKPIYFSLRTYKDKELKKEIGGFVQYKQSNEIIPVILVKYLDTDLDSPELGNYEATRIEIVNGKLTGQYLTVQTGAGTRQGKYIKYTNFGTGKSVKFTATSNDNQPCEIDK